MLFHCERITFLFFQLQPMDNGHIMESLEEDPVTGFSGTNWVKRKGKLWRPTSSLRTQERSESLEEDPVAQTARIVPSSCSCTEGRRATVPPGAFSPSIHLSTILNSQEQNS